MTKIRKLISVVLAISVAFALLTGFEISVSAADVSVSIVSFLRGEQTDLRSSELLEARVAGYDGNVRELTYEWTNEIGTYLYVYNNHNMYGINGTEGEIEIYNDNVSSSSNMSGRSYDTTFSGTGFAWAAIYGANYDNADLVGTISVKVYDVNGNLLATDSHTGTRTSSGSGSWWEDLFGGGSYKYSGFVTDDLKGDLTATHFGIFEGDSKFIKELFSESSIVHITCAASTIDGANIVSGDEYISLTDNNDGTYTVIALEPGQAVLDMTVTKENCKFHQYSEGETSVNVYVYKRPEPTPTTTTITLTNLDEDCTYYIDGTEGTYQSDGTVIFTNLTPNTTYTIEAKGQAEGTEAVYAYTTCTTLPVYNATVYVYLNGGWDAATESAYGTPVNISDIRDTDDAIYIKEVNGSEFICLEHADTGVYTASVENGTYLIYRDAEESSNPSTQQLIIDNADKERYLFYYSVDYDAAGGEGDPKTMYYYNGGNVQVTDAAPTRDGYAFVGWQDEGGNVYSTGDALTAAIDRAYTLTAVWEKTIDAYVNITIKHTAAENGGTDYEDGMHNIAFTVDGRSTGEGDYTELSAKTIEWDGESAFDVEGYEAAYADDVTVYTAVAPTFTGIPSSMEYTFTAVKHSYEIESVEVTEDADGNAVINAVLVFKPTNLDFVFKVELDEAAKALPDSLKPVAADVKVSCYYDSPSVDGEAVDWSAITHHHDTYEKVVLDESGEGYGAYSVWAFKSNGDSYYYRVEVVSYVLPDGSVMTATDVDNAHEYYSTEDRRYTAYVDVTGGAAPDGSSLDGAYFADGEQVGDVTAIISIEVFDVTFDPNGGTFADGTTAAAVVENQIAIPSFDSYVPAREGGYTFLGWYYEGTDEEAVEGTVLFKDEVLVAKWKEPLTIEGTISVAGTYELLSTQIIHDTGRAKNISVLLRKIDANGYEATIESVNVPIVYTDNLGKGTYSFTGIPDDGHEYHVQAVNTNYTTSYQNELSESISVEDYWAYTLNHGEAEFEGDNVAMVNAYLAFEPEVFDLQYAVDATAIGDNFRPEEVEMLVLYDDGLKGHDPQLWAVISQMVFGEGYEGQKTALVDGAGTDSYSVWESLPDGATLYDYAIRVAEVDGVEFDLQSAPYMIYYNGSARYSAVHGQTQLLTATIVPKMYTVTFKLDAGEDAVGGMEDYYNVIGEFQDTYYWSFGTQIVAQPVRSGYNFLGWFDENGSAVTEIAPSMHEDVVLTAKWQKLESYVNDYAYIFGYNDAIMGAEGPLRRCELSAMIHRLVKQNGKLGDFVYDAAAPSFDDIAGKWFQSGIEFMNHKGAFAEGVTSVAPYTEVTRGEAFRFICLGLSFTEDTTLTNQQYADFLYNAGYIEGDGSGDLKVNDLITRAEFCTMYNRIIGREDALLIDTEGNEVTAETYGFTDMTDKSVWYYENMVRATSAYENGYVSIEKRGIRNVLDDYAG